MMADKVSSKPTMKTKAKAKTKAAVIQEIAESTELTRKQVVEVFEALTNLIKQQLGKKGPGEFTVPGLLTLKLVRKPATKQRKAPNPFKPGEMILIKAKPARNVVKGRALKTLSDQLN
jgi:nucleoid DNA-binding protein